MVTIMTTKSIFETTDYSQFNILNGNRAIHKARVNKIISSIKKVGWITNPIIINENFEIIDGQGRFTALKTLNMPVEYIIHPGAGIEECRQMNINMNNWTVEDWVDSYAKENYQAYIYVLNLHKMYPDISLQMILSIVCTNGKRTDLKSDDKEDVKNGVLDMSSIDQVRVAEILDFCSRIIKYVKLIGGRKFLLLNAAIYAYDHSSCNRERLIYAFENNYKQADSCTKTEDCIAQIENIYNFHLKSNGVIKPLFILSDYKKDKRNTDIS